MMFPTFGFHGFLEGPFVGKEPLFPSTSSLILQVETDESSHNSTSWDGDGNPDTNQQLLYKVLFLVEISPLHKIWVIFFAGFTEIASGADFKWNKNARNKSFLYPVTNGALWAAGISQSLESGVGGKGVDDSQGDATQYLFFFFRTAYSTYIYFWSLKCMLSSCVSISEIMWGTSNPFFLADAKALVGLRGGSCGSSGSLWDRYVLLWIRLCGYVVV